jgi:hypothetical protein
MVLVVAAVGAGTARRDVPRGQTAAGGAAPAAALPPSMNSSLEPRPPSVRASGRAVLTSTASGLGFTANALVSANGGSLSRSQAEPSIASNPLNRNEMVVGYADSVTDVFPGVSRSIDGGKSWTAPSGGPLLPSPPGLSWGQRGTVGHVAAGDSALAWATGDTVYFATLGDPDNTRPATAGVCNVGGLYVYRSTDGGNTWTLPAGGPAVPNTQTMFADRDHVAADSNPASSHAGAIYLVWSDDQYSGCPQIFGTNFVTRQIMFSRSTDGGVSWSTPISLGSGCLEAAIPAVGADGSVYVAWFDCNSSGGDREMVRKSSDGGVTFSPAVAAGAGLTRCPDPLPGARFRLAGEAAPTIATDPTDAALVYVAWSSCTASAQADVFFSRSTDGGATWSPIPLRVNDDGISNPRDQFFPAITVDDQGVIRAMWGDDRLDTVNAGGHYYDIFAAASTDHGASFGTNVRVTTQSSNPDIDNGGTFIGDYFGMAPCGTAVWGDTRNGSQDIFAAGLDENGDGIVDDCVTGPPANTVLPAISGTAMNGAILTGSPGAWKGFPLPAFTVQWRRCDTLGRGCIDITGATSDSYTLVASDVGKTIRFRISGTNSLGSAAADSRQTAVVFDSGGGGGGGSGGGGGGGGLPDVVIGFSGSPAAPGIGDTLVYTLTAAIKSGNAGDVRATVNLPAEVTFVSAAANRGPGCTGTTTLSCDLDFLSGNLVAQLTIVTRVAASGTLTATASLTSTPADTNPANNSASVTTIVGPLTPPPPPPSQPTNPVLKQLGLRPLSGLQRGLIEWFATRFSTNERMRVSMTVTKYGSTRKLVLLKGSSLAGAGTTGTRLILVGVARAKGGYSLKAVLKRSGLVKGRQYVVHLTATDGNGKKTALNIKFRAT